MVSLQYDKHFSLTTFRTKKNEAAIKSDNKIYLILRTCHNIIVAIDV